MKIMKKKYFLTMLVAMFLSTFGIAQTTVNYPQRVTNYDTFHEDGGSKYNNGTDELGMWANNGTKQSVAWRDFTDNATTTGNATEMKVGDTFKISLAAYQAFGQIGISLLSSPAKTGWADRHSNYAVQVNLDGNSGTYDPWKIVSSGETENASVISGSATGTINEFVFTFTLISSTTMEVIIARTNNTPTSFTQTVTINNTNISGYSVYIADNWDGDSNQDIFWKPTTEYVYANVWDGSTDTDWDTAANWSSNSVPSATANVRIPKTGITNFPTASTAVTINSAYVKSGATLIANSTFAGTITYERNLAVVDQWYMISSPVIGQDIDVFAAAEGLATGTTASNVGLADYNNSTPGWDYYQSGSSGTGNFTSGDGRSIKLAASGDIAFTGTMPVDNFTTLSLTDNSGGSGNAFNLMGNPYPSYIASDETANATNNILAINTTLLTEETIWIWDQSTGDTGSYTQYNNTSGFHIAPGQAFFVSANGASSTFAINENMQSHQGTDTFQRTVNTRPEINLMMTDGSSTRGADIFYIDGTTTGFDNGYDSSIFGGVSHSFAVYTEAVANSNGKRLGIQSLPNSDLESMVIPVGVIAAASEITFSAAALNLPEGIKVFLEDRATSTFIRLDEANSEYRVTLTEATNGTGRFYLHTSSSSLSIDDTVNIEDISIYKNATTLKIAGMPQGKANVKLFNILGRQVLNTSFKSNGTKDISLANLASGVYIVQLETTVGMLNKKIILN
jgi:hypothetical protein